MKALKKLDNGLYAFGLLINDVALFLELLSSHERWK